MGNNSLVDKNCIAIYDNTKYILKMKLILPLGLIGLAVANPLPKPESENSDLAALVGNFEEVQYNNEDCYEDSVDMKAGNGEDDLIEEVDFLDVNVDDVEPGQSDPDEYLAKMA